MRKLAVVPVLAAVFMLAAPAERAEAVVYCKTVGVPKGCVMRAPAPAARVVYCTGPGVPVGCVVRPAAPARVVYCTGPGVPVGCVARPVGRSPVNRGGPVNRIGVR